MQASLEGPPRTKSNQCLTDNTERHKRAKLPSNREIKSNSGSSSRFLLVCIMGNFSKLLWFSELVSLGIRRLQGFSGCRDSDGGGDGGGMSVVRSTGR